MRRTEIRALFFASLVFFVGCASFFTRTDDPSFPVRACSQSPLITALEFVRGVAERNLKLLLSLIPHGESLLAVFGGGDRDKGKEAARAIYEHPAVKRGYEVGNDFNLLLMEMEPEELNSYPVLIERTSLLTRAKVTPDNPHGSGIEEGKEEVSIRIFVATIQPGTNCLLNVRSVDKDWTYIK